MRAFGRESAASRAGSATFETPRPESPGELPELAERTWRDVAQGFRPD